VSDGIELTDDEYDTFMAVLAEQRCQHSHADTACPPPPERAILTDLIAELRQASGDDRWIHLPDGHYCTPVLPLTVAADRAEARLREVSGDE
jgi:hypothetical protein